MRVGGTEWVAFGPEVAGTVEPWLAEHADVTAVIAKPLASDGTDTHPLRTMFADGARVVDLALEPELFPVSVDGVFFRADVLDAHELGPVDATFAARYLLAAGSSTVGFVGSATYVPTTEDRADPALLLDLLHAGGEHEWVQHYVLYELGRWFRAETAMVGTSTLTGDAGEHFRAILREITQYLDPDVVETDNVARLDSAWRQILVHLNDERWVSPYAVVTRYDATKKQARVVYRYRDAAPSETFVCLGEPTEPAAAKVRAMDFFGATLLHERIAWVPVTRTTRLLLDGRPVPLRDGWPDAGRTTLRQYPLRQMFAPPRRKPVDATTSDRVLLKLAASGPVRKRYAGAWVLMDRVTAADDNGERLFRYLRDHRKDVNAWFVIGADTPDYKRLKEDGYDHVVAYGSRQWYLLMLNCCHLIASHTERPVRRPPEITRLVDPAWRFTFLQHGVIKDDLSNWLNPKPIDVFVTSTADEYESIAGDGSPYVFTSKEVTLSGLPRFDRLLEVAAQTPDADLVLVCPTWRFWLSPRAKGDLDRGVVPDFAESGYARQWLALLRDESLRDAAAAQGLRLGFLPHPHLQSVLPDLDLPDWVEPLTYAGEDVQRIIARSAVMITDYSSMAFNAGYLDRPVVYFQFDAERMRGGGHVGSAGYYDYAQDGFGPVTTTLDEAVVAAVNIVGNGVGAEYAARSARAFPNRDGRCCERVTAAIEALDRE